VTRAEEGGSEGGFNIVEIVVAMAVMMVVLMVGMVAASTAVKVEAQATGKGQATTQVVAALTELRQEIVSANIIFDPGNDVYTSGPQSGVNYAGANPDGTKINPGWSLRIYTQLNGNAMCVQWRLLDSGALQTRLWTPSWSQSSGEQGTAYPWSTLATNVVNTQAPFSLNYSANYGGSNSRLVIVTLLASARNANVKPQLLQSSIAARDAEYYPANTLDCYPVPTP
jgi:flagellar basal body-associated protein FliL